MDCPSCSVEMVKLDGDDPALHKCGECGGLWVDVADLNRMLLHHNLPGLETLGGKVNPDEMVGQCPQCQVDLVRVDGGTKQDPRGYDMCESCGGVFIESDEDDHADYERAKKEIINFFNKFRTDKRK